MKIAVVSPFPPSRGTLNEYAWHFVNALRAKPEVREVIVLADELPADACYTPPAGAAGLAPVRIRPTWRFGDPRNALRIARTLRLVAPDAVVFNMQFATFGGGKLSASLGLLAPWLARRLNLPVFVLMHNIMETVDLKQAGYARHPLAEKVIRAAGALCMRAVLGADVVGFTMPKYVDVVRERYGATNAVLLPHGSFNAPPAAPCAPAAQRQQVLTFGKFGTYKRVEVLIEAVSVLRAQAMCGVELVIAGTDSPNAPGYLAGVMQATRDKPWVRFTGYVDEADVPGLFEQAGVVVFPYTATTGSSGPLHQAGSFGRAAVLPVIGDLAELLNEEGYDGEYFTPDDAASLAAAIGRVLSDPQRRLEIEQRNLAAARGLSIHDTAEWCLLHIGRLIASRRWSGGMRQRVPPPAGAAMLKLAFEATR